MNKNKRLSDSSNSGKKDSKKDEDDEKKRCCARCRNHETELVELKGHKNYCPWRDCFCELCLKTVFRQKLMADQTASRRKRDEMKERAKKGLPLVVPTAKQARLKNPFVPIPPTPEQSPLATYLSSQRSKEVSWEAITELMDAFNFNVNTSCLLYLILKYISNNNVRDARSIIQSAKEDIKRISNKTFSNGTGPVIRQSVYTLNQLDVVPVFVVPSEKVLDLSSQQGIASYPRPVNQNYPYPRPALSTNVPIGPLPPPHGAAPQCVTWKQPYRQPWPNSSQPYEQNSFNEVPLVKKIRIENENQIGLDENKLEENNGDKDRQFGEENCQRSEDNLTDIEKKNYEIKTELVSMNKKEDNLHVNEGGSGIYKNYKVSTDDKMMDNYKDEYSIYAENIGNKLRTITDRHSLNVAKYEIDRVVLKAMTGEYFVGS